MNQNELINVVQQKALRNTKNWNLPREERKDTFDDPALVIVGPTASGKTTMMTQAGSEIKYPVIAVRFSQVPYEDLAYPVIVESPNGEKHSSIAVSDMIPTLLNDSNGDYVMQRKVDEDGNIVVTDQPAINFEKLKGFISNYEEMDEYYRSIGLEIHDAPGALFFLDEMNRIMEAEMFQTLFQILEEGVFRGKSLPKTISITSAINPASKDYILRDWFADKAFASRCVFVAKPYSVEDWLEGTKGMDYHPGLRMAVETDSTLLFDAELNDFNLPTTQRDPRRIIYVQNLALCEDMNIPSNVQAELIGNAVGESYIPLILDSIEKTKMIKPPTPLEILTEYDEYDLGDNPLKDNDPKGRDTFEDAFDNQIIESDVRKVIVDAINSGQKDLYDRSAENLADEIIEKFTERDDEFIELLEKNRMKLLRFLLDLPRGDYFLFMRKITNKETNKAANFTTSKLIDNKKYSNASYFLAAVNNLLENSSKYAG